MDGPLGTELDARGVPTLLPLWSAGALVTAPDVVREIHESYARAGASVHTTNTFRTRRRTTDDWEPLARRAVELARLGARPRGRVAGGLAPLEDCYRPDSSPADPGPEHAELAHVLADAGCDLLLCETFPHVGEALAAVDACLATGLPTWLSLTAGPSADLLSPQEVRRGAREAVARGVSAVLVNCVPASETARYVDAVADLGVPFGAYANAGHADERIGWARPEELPGSPEAYAEIAAEWVDAGATILGSCCGTGPAHIEALVRRFRP